jgi:cytoskeletal protein CcmA (bactofilin family)
MQTSRVFGNERGIALVVVLLVVLAVAALVGGAALLGSGTALISRHEARQSVLETAAEAGLEEGRSRINGARIVGDTTVFPDSGFRALETRATVVDAGGAPIPNVNRWLYVGPSGVTTGQYGVFGSIVAVTQDAQGDRVIRRNEIFQESFSRYAYFTTVEGNVVFGSGDQIFGPVHSDDDLHIDPSGATFNGPVSTAKTIQGRANGVYRQGYRERAPYIAMPTTAALTKLRTQAQIGGMAITSTTFGNQGQATTRIEFVAVDLDGDNDSTDADEGFMKVYQVASPGNAWWVVADTFQWKANGVRNSPNCGHIDAGVFKTFERHTATTGTDAKSVAPGDTTKPRACFLGGADNLNSTGQFELSDARGRWLPWTGSVDPRLTALRGGEASYLWPINRALNPNFKGVVYVDGKVAVSGKLRGRVTVAATDNIVIADDITYVTDPGSVNCADILGLFSAKAIVVADNLINDPIPWASGKDPSHWDADSWNESIDGFVLALDMFTAQNYNEGSNDAEPCDGKKAGRGCLFLTGGVIQTYRGAVGFIPTGSASGTGYVKRYAYDRCGATDPPPYFPTTGHFLPGHSYEVDPTGFDINAYWKLLTPH